jgi:hypothetical protein
VLLRKSCARPWIVRSPNGMADDAHRSHHRRF